MLEHGFIKIEDEVMENGGEIVTNYNKRQQIQDHTANDDIFDIEDKSLISKIEVTEYTTENSNSFSNVKTNSFSENTKNCLENNKISDNAINNINVPITTRRQSNESAFSMASDKADIKVCDNNCTFYQKQELIFQCKFCDLNYGAKENFKRHVLEDHKMIHLVKDLAHENSPLLRKRIDAPVDPFDNCANVFILNHLFLVCRHCECEFSSEDLFETHLRQEHNIFERSRIKTETSTDTVNTTEPHESDIEAGNLQDIETNVTTLAPKAMKGYATKRKCTISSDKQQQEDSTSIEIKLEPDVLPNTPQKPPKMMDKIRHRIAKTPMKTKLLTSIAAEELEESNQVELNDPSTSTSESIVERVGKHFKCNECDKEFLKIDKFLEHKQQHFFDKKYKCTLCELAFVSQRELCSHMRHHSTDCRFKCSQCPKGFVRNSDLKIHLRTHTGEKSFVCDVCNKSFRAKQNLSVHKKSHMGEASRTYKCEYCDKKFIRNIDRKIHFRKHTKEKPFKCDICDRGYSSKFNLQVHVERDHINGIGRKKRETPRTLKQEFEIQKKMIEELQQQLLQRSQAAAATTTKLN